MLNSTPDYVTDESQLRDEIADLKRKVEQANHRLVRVVRQRAFYRAKQNTKCAVLSAILMAISPKTSADSKLRFSLEPPTIHDGVEEWKRAMRIMARLPGGIPNIFRNKLWSTLGELHVLAAGLDWEQICRSAFSEHVQSEDIEIHSQILKDLHRTGWSEFDDEKKLKQVLLAYARYNKEIGYCQGFNVIAALILQVVDYRTDIALKVMIFLIEHVLPRGYFDQSLKALSVDMTVMKDLMLQRVPNTIEHLEHLKNTSGGSSLEAVVYTMAEFPYPGLAELREKYTWNIHPLSATFKLFRKSVTDILHDDSSDGEPSCSPCEFDRQAMRSEVS
ncbi:TBC domain protein [Ancylostoma duodenale]|uniref:TBC domain protein n=1 Tax=Ancylostoma duodenale TaxID=51022 RepID=A0A0C2FT44_9BILA|nr:TBC domain protein [Ancylostoma duodenale]